MTASRGDTGSTGAVAGSPARSQERPGRPRPRARERSTEGRGAFLTDRSPYVIEYAGRFDFTAPPRQVWSAIEHFERYEAWWGWLRELRVEGPGLAAGSVLHGIVAPPLPYRMRLRVVLVGCQPRRSIDA